jgi:hypothetical protein
MNQTAAKKQITETFRHVSLFSLKKKREQDELVMNHFLDSILKLQSDINNDSNFLETLVDRFEKISWMETSLELKSSENTLNLINAIISVTIDIHRLILERYIFVNKNAKSYASKEIKRLKTVLDDIKEACTDLENIFIILPEDNHFQLANSQLQNL